MSNYHLKMERGESKETPKIEMPETPEEETFTEQEAAAPEASEPIEESYEEEENKQQASPSEKKPTPQESFKQLREEKERLQRERDELAKQMQNWKAQQEQSSSKKEAEEEDYHLNPDDLVEAKHLSKYEKKLQALEAQWKQQSVEQQLRKEYKDFDNVVTEENISQLAQKYPQVANTLRAPGELYDKAVAAYTLIKNMGIYVEDNYGADKARAQKNASKPRPLTSVSPQQGDSPLSHANAFANGLTDELKAKLHREMTDAMKNY